MSKKNAVSSKILTIEDLVGQTETDAITWIRALGMRCRVMRRDKESFMGTCDYRTDRVNLEVDNGNVTKASIG